MILGLFNGDVLSTAEVINRHLLYEELDWVGRRVRSEKSPQKSPRRDESRLEPLGIHVLGQLAS